MIHNGSIFIRSQSDIDELSDITRITGYLFIENNAALTNLDGLSKLESVGDLKGTVNNPIQIQLGSRHTIVYTLEEAIIGCECHTIKHWLEHYKEIAEKHNYTQKEIEEYLEYYNKVFGK